MKTKYPFRCIIKYIPSRYSNLQEWQQANQRLVYHFKHGMIEDRHKTAILDAIKGIIKDRPDEWVVAFVPASTNAKTIQRYSSLSSFLKDHLGCPVSLSAIKNFQDYEPVHLSGETVFKIHAINKEYFADKRVVLIDDIVTTGRSFKTMGDKLIYLGALSVYGVCFAMTIHPNLPTKQKHY